MNMSLRTRMLLLALLPATLVAVLLTAVFVLYAIENLDRELRTRGEAISRQMSRAAEYGIFSGQRDSLSALTESALRIDPDARGAAIIDVQGAIMARSGDLNPSAWPDLARFEGQRLGPDVLLFVEPVMRSSVAVDDIYAGAEVLRAAKSKAIGYVVVELSLREISIKRKWLIAAGVLVAMLGAALGGWLARRIARAVTDPILEASEVVGRIGSGDLSARMATESAGTLRSLAAGINDMAERIGVTQEELRERVTDATLDLLREKEAAEHATIAKSHFLAAASHDLRQPLHALGLFVSGLAQSNAAKHEPKLVAQIQSSVDTLQNLLDAILDISRLDGGNVVPRLGSFALGDVLDRLADDLSLLADQKGLQLKLRPTQIWVHSDQKIVERILLNLVGNALRYTRHGGVLVSCRRRRDVVRVEVWDTGEGIPEHSREEIFEEYVQLGNSERDQAKGLGLGLAICRRLAGLLGIPMGVRSRPGRGSVFWIELPAMQEVAPAPVVEPLPAQQAPDHAQIFGTVLVVEDDVMVRAGMEQAILGWGGRVLLAANREEALRCCRESALLPDLAICTIHLPGMVSGIGLAEELQREFGPMSILLVSADASGEAQIAARRAGFPLLKKPVPPGRLRAALQHLLSVPV
ncbi:MAG: ATP-binding protein [Sulfuritalea sp.]|nr:ATP-binding protein [Sulfuritalea sp.]